MHGLKGLSRVIYISLFLWFLLVVGWSNIHLRLLQAGSPRDLPFGVFLNSDGTMFVQDFSYNVLYLKGIGEQRVSRPYLLENQEKLMRQVVPGLQSGMTHAYSPVAFVLVRPFLGLSGDKIYLIYTVLGAVASLCLLYFYLLPRVQSIFQLYAIAAAVTGVCLTAAFATGQSTLITTPVLGALWALLQKTNSPASLTRDSLLALLFWFLCLKPSVALVAFFPLLGVRNWRALGISAALLLVTWTATAGYYGGWWPGLRDYYALLSQYNPSDFPPFLRRGDDSAINHFLSVHAPALTSHLFVLNRTLFLVMNLALIVARWGGRITASEHFQGAVWAFLLFSPYLLGSEYWIMVLLVVEGPFFSADALVPATLKFLLLFGILDLRSGVNASMDFSFPCKWLLFLWVVVAAILERFRQKEWFGQEEALSSPMPPTA